MLLIQIISLKHNTEKIIWEQNSYVYLDLTFLKDSQRHETTVQNLSK